MLRQQDFIDPNEKQWKARAAEVPLDRRDDGESDDEEGLNKRQKLRGPLEQRTLHSFFGGSSVKKSGTRKGSEKKNETGLSEHRTGFFASKKKVNIENKKNKSPCENRRQEQDNELQKKLDAMAAAKGWKPTARKVVTNRPLCSGEQALLNSGPKDTPEYQDIALIFKPGFWWKSNRLYVPCSVTASATDTLCTTHVMLRVPDTWPGTVQLEYKDPQVHPERIRVSYGSQAAVQIRFVTLYQLYEYEVGTGRLAWVGETERPRSEVLKKDELLHLANSRSDPIAATPPTSSLNEDRQ